MMELHNLPGRRKNGYTTWGCIWEKGACRENTVYQVRNSDNTRVLAQSRITAYWPDGSVKWTAHCADSGKMTDVITVSPAASGEEQDSFGNRVLLEKTEKGMTLDAGVIRLEYQTGGSCLFDRLYVNGRLAMEKGAPVLILEEPAVVDHCAARLDRTFEAEIQKVSVEETGPVFVVLKYEGVHISAQGQSKIPFVIRMKVGLDSKKLNFVHTFFYDGEEDKDFLKGIGVEFTVPMKGKLYNRHVKAEVDHGCFHEAAAQLLTWRPRISQEVYRSQMSGEMLALSGEEQEKADTVMKAMPFWDTYEICQDRVNHFGIRKKTAEDGCCFLNCLDGERTEGGAAFGSEDGSVLFGIRDFWERYPSGYRFEGLTGDQAKATVWLFAPGGGAKDFRHYAQRGYNQTYYEGYDFKGADPVGIACTSEFSVGFSEKMIPGDEELKEFSEEISRPAQYVGTPEYYHSHHTFGRWSLPSETTEMEQWLEEQLDEAVKFYEDEVRQRNWYGMFDYGDFMHTYDRERHQWRYDMGGYAWDNTELVPTLWLWLYFMRTGREDVFELAEKLSRHASEVDVYHFGKYQGMGSRHNVSHWGCPCKEARIAMAAHHRFFYYLTGDERMGDVFEELKDNEKTFLNKDPLEAFYPREEMVYPSHARSGPDWSSLCANWMTRWERFKDDAYREKIEVGIRDIASAPLRLVSGPDFEFDPVSTHLRYIGERAAGGTHLQICMGAPEVWIELSELLEDKNFEEMLAEYGWFYYLPREEQIRISKGIIKDREFSLPFMAAAMGAYGAWYRKDKELAKTTWAILLESLVSEENRRGFERDEVEDAGNQEVLKEIPWLSTNFAAQWCLNVIMVLEFIRPELPETMEEAVKLVKRRNGEGFHRA